MVHDRRALDGGPRSESSRAVAPQVGVGVQTLRVWCNRYGPPGRFAGLGEIRRIHAERLIAAGVQASVGSVDDRHDNALTETVDVFHQAERIHRYRVWLPTIAIEIATLDWITLWDT
ncbi:hypothetical protein M3C14_002640 [Micrococcus luteus]|nr:hypothetical protein [Micrococcus luteus]